MNEPLSDRRVVVITGGSDGIGAAAARMLARRGDHIVLVGRSPGKTRSVATEIGAEHHVADFAHLGQVRELAAGLVRQHPRIDVRARSEPPPPGVIMGKWSSGQPFSHDHDADGRGMGLDHGSSAPGTTVIP